MAVSVGQLQTLIHFLESHRDIALGRCTRTTEGRSLAQRKWAECAQLLNSMSINCTQKTSEQWRAYYNEMKCKLLKKIKNEKNSRNATGGGPPVEIQLTPLQERLYEILGRDAGDPLPGVRHNPLINAREDHDYIMPGMQAGSSGDANNFMESMDDPLDVTNQSNDIEIEIIDREVGRQELPEETEELDALLELEKQDIENYKENKTEKEAKKKEEKKQKKKKEKQNKNKENINIDEPEIDITMKDAAASLQKIEKLNADAMLVHAAAINRLAAAIERLADRIPTAPLAAASASNRQASLESDSAMPARWW